MIIFNKKLLNCHILNHQIFKKNKKLIQSVDKLSFSLNLTNLSNKCEILEGTKVNLCL